MTVFEEMKKSQETVRSDLNYLTSVDRNVLYGKERLAGISFEHNGKEAFEATFDLFTEVTKCNLDRIPPQQLKALSDRISNFKSSIEKAKNLSLESSENPRGQRDTIVSEIQAQYQANYNAIAPIIGFAERAGTDFKKIEREAKTVLADAKSYTEQSKKMFDTKSAEVDAIMTAVRAAAAESGVAQNAIHYKIAEDSHKDTAAKWLRGAVLLSLFLIVFICAATVSLVLTKENPKFELTYIEVGLTMLLALNAYGIRFASKQYQAHRHLTVVNSEKAKALSTFRAFAEATDNKEVKDIILQQAGCSIFSLPASGYLNQKETSPSLPAFYAARKFSEEFGKPYSGNA